VNYYETKRTSYAGPVGGSILRTTYTCYNGAPVDCSGTALSLPFSQVTQLTQLDNNQQSQVNTYYNTFVLPTEVDEYDFGSGTAGSLLRKTLTAYTGLGNNIVDRVANVTVQDGGGSQKAYTSYGYDESGLTGTSGVPQHVGISGSRGNLTSINQWVNTTGGYLTTSMTYEDTGNVLTSTDPGGHQTQFSYADNF